MRVEIDETKQNLPIFQWAFVHLASASAIGHCSVKALIHNQAHTYKIPAVVFTIRFAESVVIASLSFPHNLASASANLNVYARTRAAEAATRKH